MRKNLFTLLTAGLVLMLGSCWEGGKPDGNVITGGPGIGIDTATIAKMDLADALESLMADTIVFEKKAPKDDLHSYSYIRQRVNAMYESMDDQTCCSQHYLALRALAEKAAQMRGKTLTSEADLVKSHWTLGDDEDKTNPEWSYKILSVEKVTKNHAEVLVEVKKYYETKLKLILVQERDDWYVDNFDMLTQVGFDATVQVYEEHEVYYNEKEMMENYIVETIEDADEEE